jgi:hypothetical protein
MEGRKRIIVLALHSRFAHPSRERDARISSLRSKSNPRAVSL